MTSMPDLRNPDAWALDPALCFLNHGSFGACPREVLEAQTRWRERMEADPMGFFEREIGALLGSARRAVAGFLGADPDGFGFVPNATTGVWTILAALELMAGDEVLTSDHAYPAVANAIERACAAGGARARSLPVDLPLTGELLERLDAAITDRTKLVVIDHITSPTGVILPIESVVETCAARGVPVLVDAAHAPGMVPVDVDALGATFWTGNFHKWLCAPKGAAGLWVAPEWRERIRPLVISQPWLESFTDRFDWTGTFDPSAWLSVPDAIGFLAAYGWEDVRARNRALALEGRDVVAAAIGAERLVDDDHHGWMSVVPLPSSVPADRDVTRALSATLARDHRIEVPVTTWRDRAFVRLSAHLYNERADYELLAAALPKLL